MRRNSRTCKIEIQKLEKGKNNLLNLVETDQAVPGDIKGRLTEIRETQGQLEASALKARAKVSNERTLTANPKKVAAYAKSLQTWLREENVDRTKEIMNEVIVQVRIRQGEEKDTTTVIIRYRIPMPPREWKESADVEELLLRKKMRSLESPAPAGMIRNNTPALPDTNTQRKIQCDTPTHANPNPTSQRAPSP